MNKHILIFIYLIPLFLFPANLSIKKLDINQGLSNNSCQGLALDKQGFLWIGTESGLNRFDGDEFKSYYTSETNQNSIISNELNDIYADKNEDIENSISKCNFADKIGNFVFFQSQEE